MGWHRHEPVGQALGHLRAVSLAQKEGRVKLLAATLLLAVLLLITGQSPAHPKPLPRHFVAGAKCIQSHEGSWRDAGAPYWGGMQMDWGFMETYGTWLLKNVGTADRWTPHQQLHISYRAFRGWKGHAARGFGPWPNTRKMCGV